MSSTYSINIGSIIESTRKPDIFSVLQEIPNNTQKLISPRDVRDAFLTTWANSSFRSTTGYTFSSIEYIGIDSGNPDNRDIKQKILIGKRSYGGLDILTDALNTSDSDIFLFNTKGDTQSQLSTKISILSGTNSTLHSYAPYLESIVNGTSTAIDLNITNPSLFGGDINVYSSTGRVSLNGIIFPTVSETSIGAANGKILTYSGSYPNGSLIWDDLVISISSIGIPGSPTNIYGDPVLLNGQSLEFIDTSIIPQTIGGVTQGSSFPIDSFTAGGFTSSGYGQDWPLSEIIRKILYPYIEPVLELSVTDPTTTTIYSEAGTTPSLQFDWSITTYARDDNEYINDFFFREDNSDTRFKYGSSFSATPGSSTSSIFNYLTYSTLGSLDFSLQVSNIPGSTSFGFPTNYDFSATSSIEFINPIFYGYNTTLITDASTLTTVVSTSTKLIEPYISSYTYSVPYNGSGYLYFIHPNTFTTDIQYIKDSNGFILYDYSSPTASIFTHSNYTHPNYTGPFKVWRTIGTSSYTGGGQFEFIF